MLYSAQSKWPRQLNLDMISEDRSMIIMRATKKDEAVRLPILSKAEEILLKYNFEIPLIFDQKYKKSIKDFLK